VKKAVIVVGLFVVALGSMVLQATTGFDTSGVTSLSAVGGFLYLAFGNSH
jgi:hypothetical protein